MKKILALALALSATVLLASPTKDGIAKCGIMDGGCQFCAGERPQCDTSKLPPRLEALGLSDDQKAQVQKIREDGKTFRAQQHDKIKAVLTPEQQKKFEETSKTCPKKGVKMKPKMPAAGMGCKSCDKK
ncbi:MAG: periplasmic protein CpxP/Spy [Campylobacterota bacterium]|nr:periplasmic protein CpxP/Spy [Campylobacterota bacterium]